MSKPKISSDWLGACAGCHMSLLDIDERIAEIAELADIRATPITDLKAPDAEGVEVGILSGAVNLSTHHEVTERMRERARLLVAFGDCAVFGGVIAQRNLCGTLAALRRAYIEAESNDESAQIPQHPDLGVPEDVKAIHEIAPVDVFIPGCPPHPDVIYYALKELAQGRIPQIKDDKLHWE
ncbi:MAG: NADP oxidoreductase [Anaerolineae bacterium]|nr:MAG: NADP oxidoreductase [Anaerolineae bacterium]